MPNYPPYQQPLLDGLRQKVSRQWQRYFDSLVPGGGSPAPASGTFVLTTANSNLPNSAVLTSSTTITVNTATSGQVSFDSIFKIATATLTNANIIALSAGTPFEIVAAQGTGVAIIPVRVILKTYITSGNYGNISDPSYLNLQYANAELASGYLANDSTTTPVLTQMTTLLAGGFNTITSLQVPYQQTVDPAADEWGTFSTINTMDITNDALQMVITNTGTFSGGHADNLMVVETHFFTVSV